MTSARLSFNGIQARTGRPLLPALSAAAFGRIALGLPVDEETLALLKDFLAGNAVRDARRAPRWDVKDPTNLAETGWGVLFAPGVSQDVEDALAPLLNRRRDQMEKRFFKEFRGVAAGSSHELLSMPAINHQQGTSPDAERLPYYLLLVGDPSRLPFRLQVQLDVRHAVGRLDLANAEEYAAYAKAVVAAEKGERPRDLDLAFFSVKNAGDVATERTAKELVTELADALGRQRSDWQVRTVEGSKATRERLGRLLRTERPSLLFTASHGVGYECGDPDQIERQGALICADWPGAGSDLYDDYCFAGSDVPPDADLAGAIAFLFACYGVGTPERDSFAIRSLAEERKNEAVAVPKRIAASPFTSRLPQRLLAAGALAVIGHVDRAWTTSFTWNEEGGHVRTYNDMFRLLMDGYPVGWAMEQMNLQAADLGSAMNDLWKDRDFLQPQDLEVFADLWLSSTDARNFVVLGDPAVRLNLPLARDEEGSPSGGEKS